MTLDERANKMLLIRVKIAKLWRLIK